MNTAGLRAATTCLLVLVAPLPAQPTDSVETAAAEGPDLLRSGDLLWAGVFASGLALVVPAGELEERIARSGDEDGRGLDAAVADVGGVVGNGYLNYALAAGTYLAGRASGSAVAARVGLRTVESLAVADVLAGLFKVITGRARPEVTEDSRNFRFFETGDDYRSFPSGHASHVFAVAATVSRELGDRAPWVPYLAYPLASFVAASRVVGREHWVTDVISGTAVGILSSRLIGRFHGSDRRVSAVLRPTAGRGRGGGFAFALAIGVR